MKGKGIFIWHSRSTKEGIAFETARLHIAIRRIALTT